jgi:uncharacterized protein YegP (UPF0339 family)
MAFEIFQSEKTGKYHFRLKARNGEVILTSQAYAQKNGAENGVESVTKNAREENFELKEATDGREYFVLKAANGQVIGQSQMYKSSSGCRNGVQSVITNAREGAVKDLTEA